MKRLPIVALIGQTNAGKSSLLNRFISPLSPAKRGLRATMCSPRSMINSS